MKKQDKYLYDSTILGLDNQYIARIDGSFYINSPCIQVSNHTLTTGSTYILNWSLPESAFRLFTIMLIDVYCDNVRINLDVQEVATQKQFTLNYDFRVKQQCQWKLMDLKLNDDDLFEIEEFCACR
jgi:hypothetical protein